MDSVPSITDWIQAIGVLLGVPATVYGIFKLFKKDKEREAEVNALKGIAKTQVDALIQMELQVQELKYQSRIFSESNDILKEQIRIQTEAFINDRDYKENLLELQRKQRKVDNQPQFIFANGLSDASLGYIKITVRNIGKRAIFYEILGLEEHPNLYISFPAYGTVIDENKELNLSARPKTATNANTFNFEFAFAFTDIDGVVYTQKVSRTGGKYQVTLPIEIQY